MLRLPGLFLLLMVTASSAQAIKLGDAQLPDSWPLGSQTLKLNGAGIRLYGFLKIKVYAAALYLPEPQHDAGRLLAQPGPKVLHMQFFRNASGDDTRRAWAVYFEKNCSAPCTLPATQLAKFYALLPETVASETQTFFFHDESIEIARNGVVLGSVEGRGFPRLLLSTWIGNAPTTPELKAALLGLP